MEGVVVESGRDTTLQHQEMTANGSDDEKSNGLPNGSADVGMDSSNDGMPEQLLQQSPNNAHIKANFSAPPFRAGRGGYTNPFNRPPHSHATANNPSQAAGTTPAPQFELWVETKTEDGKSYYYHALTRETTWTKPEGPNIRIMTQAEIEEMNKKQLQHQQVPPQSSNVASGPPISNNNLNREQAEKPNDMQLKGPPNATLTQPPPNLLSQPPPQMQQPAPMSVGGGPPFFPPPGGMHQVPFGMPPPGFHGAPPGGPAPWGMPWNQQQQQQHMHGMPAANHEKPAKNLIIKPGVIDPAVIARAAEWSEHRAPDGRPYYFHAGRGESVWEKPQALRDMEAARMAAHGGGAVAPTQPAAAAPPAIPGMPPHMMAPHMMHHMPPVMGGFDPMNAAYNAAAAAVANMKAETTKAIQAAALEKEAKKNAAAAEEKRKKEEEQKKSASAPKPIDKSRPISSTAISGTPWCVVWTGDARVFFYNPSTRTSVWERPEDLMDRPDVDKAVNTVPDQLKGTESEKADEKKVEPEKAEVNNSSVAESRDKKDEDEDNDDDEVIKIRTESESSVEEVPSKKPRTGKARKADANEAAVEAEVRAAKERAVVPLETRIKQFKDMLREKDVSAFSTWEKELHKIVFDQRYLLLTSKERKQVFEKYVKDRAEEERKEKRNKMRQKRDDFRKLMEEAKLHGKSSFSEFCQRFTKDDRFRAIEKIRERESLFNEYIVEVRRREKEEKQQKKEQVRRDFLDMLRERSDIDRHTRWYDIKKKFENDSRYRAVENSGYREEYFEDYIRNYLKDEKRKQRDREKEKERERDRRSDRKSDRKDSKRDRSRSNDRDRDRSKDSKNKERDKDKEKDKDKAEKDKDKEKSKLDEKKKRDVSDEGEHTGDEEDVDAGENGKDNTSRSDEEEDREELERREREKRERQQQSLREREKEVQRTLAGVLRDRDKERQHHKRDEAIGHLNALLTDLVKNPDLTWKEVKRQLRKDRRWELVEILDRDEREKIFNEHIDNLMKKKREKFREMLDEVATLELTSSWKDVKKLIKEDPRYLKYNNSEKCEREFRDYIKDKTMQAKNALRELLQECKLISHKTIDTINENPNHLKEIQDILKNDKRYLVLEHATEERTTIILNYLEELHKRGPPPPPTASESTRRNKN